MAIYGGFRRGYIRNVGKDGRVAGRADLRGLAPADQGVAVSGKMVVANPARVLRLQVGMGPGGILSSLRPLHSIGKFSAYRPRKASPQLPAAEAL